MVTLIFYKKSTNCFCNKDGGRDNTLGQEIIMGPVMISRLAGLRTAPKSCTHVTRQSSGNGGQGSI